MTDILLQAIHFASEKHKNQRRKDIDKTPYINHPVSVAFTLSNIGKVTDNDVLIAALLHDTVEDTNTSLDEIESKFGSKVRSIVNEVTDDRSLDKIQRKKAQIEHARSISKEAKLVKLADKIDNMNGLLGNPPSFWGLDEIRGYFVWCYFVCQHLRSVNEYLDKQLSYIFNSTFLFEDKWYDVLPDGDLEKELERYYGNIKQSE